MLRQLGNYISLEFLLAGLYAVICFFSLKPMPEVISFYISGLANLIALTVFFYFRKKVMQATLQRVILVFLFVILLTYITILPTHDQQHKLWILLVPFSILLCLTKSKILNHSVCIFYVIFLFSLIPQVLSLIFYVFGWQTHFYVIDAFPGKESRFYFSNGMSVFLNTVTFPLGDSLSYINKIPQDRLFRVVTRLSGFFDEPGVVGTVCGLYFGWMRVHERYSLKSIFILICGILSFSFAFFVLFFISLFKAYQPFGKALMSLILFVLIFVSYSSSGGYFFIRSMFFERLNLTSVSDQIYESFPLSQSRRDFYLKYVEGRSFDFNENVRESKEFRTLLNRTFSNWKYALFGVSSDANKLWGGDNFSFRLIFTNYGVVGFVILLAIFTVLFYPTIRYSNILILTSIFIFILSFLQRPYVWMPWNFLILGSFAFRDNQESEG